MAATLGYLGTSCSKSNDDIIPSVGNANYETTLSIDEMYNAEAERTRLWRRQKIADFVATGVYVQPEGSVKININLTEGNHLPQVLLGTYAREQASDAPKVYNLGNGTTTITNTSGKNQMIYIRYSSAEPNSSCNVTITGGIKTPYFVYNSTSQEDFENQLETYEYDDALLSSEYATMLISREVALKFKDQDWVQLMETLDHIIDVEAEIDGLDNSTEKNQREKNRYFLTESSDPSYYMAASNYKTFYNDDDAIEVLVNQTRLTGDGWGVWHELGHQHQIESLTWDDVSEVTVNVYSLAVERAMGISPSKLARDGHWETLNDFFAKDINDRDFNDDLGYFQKLCLYQQLWLAYGDDFFITLHQRARAEAKDLRYEDEKMAYLALLSSEIAGENLSDFFMKWGFKLSDDSNATLAALGFPEPDEDLTLLRE